MKIINISNRLPISVTQKGTDINVTPSSGGLASALASVDKDDAELVWVGVADFKKSAWTEAKSKYNGNYNLVPVFVNDKQYKLYYEGFSNSVLWPLFHYFPSYVDFDNKYEEAYRDVNRQIAEQVIGLIEQGDIVWVHDYHLFMLPELIRKAKPEAKIGFFLHIPFPAYELMRILPKKTRSMMLNGVLGADVIGFHTFDYCKHFLETIQIENGISHEFFNFNYQDRNIEVKAFPISIDYEKFNSAYLSKAVIEEKEKIKTLYSDKKIIFSVDRLDYSKGIMFRLRGYQRFLELNPDWHEKVVFILVLIPSRTDVNKYSERKQMIDSLVSHINGKVGNFKWTPIVYQFHSLNFEELSGLYTGCDIALISPIRDGMNLVAKEFVASRNEESGVLMLSEMTGAAKELNEALLFNPLDDDEIAEKLGVALNMSLQEQKRRMSPMHSKIKKFDIHFWTNSFLDTIISVKTRVETIPIGFDQKRAIIDKFTKASRRLILLDYDGTLTDFKPIPADAKPTSEVFSLINLLSVNERNKVVIISGRNKNTLEGWFGHEKIDMVAEHGAFIKKDKWTTTIKESIYWRQPVLDIMSRFYEVCQGSFIEQKEFALAWHYRQCEPETGYIKSRELIETLQFYISNSGAKILDGNKVVEVKSAYINKGTAINTTYDFNEYDFCIAIGDDKTDEDMFKVINDHNGISIKVGNGNTCASFRFAEIKEVVAFLHELNKN